MSDKIKFDIYSCVRVYYRYADCNKCVEVCPVDAVYIDNDKVHLNGEKCIDCGACVGNCPTESFTLNGFNPNEFVESFSKVEENLISCKLNVPCLSTLSPEHLSTVVLSKKDDIILDIGHCQNCSIGKQLNIINSNVDMANYILSSVGFSGKVKLEDLKYEKPTKQENSRRSILKLFAKKTVALAFWTVEDKLPLTEEEKEERDFKNIVSEKVVPQKRVSFIEALSSYGFDENSYFEVDKINFTSDKWIDNNLCTNCGICGNICPTGAITNSDDRLKVLFNPSICIKCRICHDICPEKCLHLQDKLYVEDFVSNKYKILSTHVMIPCSECLVPFSYKGDTTVCPRCRQLEDELKELLKIGD
ncbi:MAG: 4Fe-4S binding protein [Hydrogenothermaceae bacterium]|nr:4Fe-4S binding protein [Hydrogenothermaceae bacterium]